MDKAFHFRISFSQSWILSKRGTDTLPVDWVASEVKNRYSASDIRTRISDCDGMIKKTDDKDSAKLLEELRDLIAEKYDISADSDVFTIALDEVELPPEEEPEKAGEEPKEEKKTKGRKSASEKDSDEEEKPKKSLLDKKEKPAEKKPAFDDLVGAEEFKALADECRKMAPALIENDLIDTFTCRSYIISVNDGYGLTTYLEMFAELVDELGLFELRSKPGVSEVKLPPPDTRQSGEAQFSDAMQYFNSKTGGKIVCIDISEWMNKTADKDFRDFLRKLDDHAGENIVFFRIPFVERNIVGNIRESLNDMMFVRSLSIPPFSGEEIRRCAEAMLTSRGFTMEADSWDIFNARVAAEKSDGRFYGINTVRKIIREMLYVRQLCCVDAGVSDTVIRPDEIAGLTGGDVYGGKGFEDLAALIGMEKISERVKEIVAQIEASVKNNSVGTPCIHMRFVGKPGTGKTTVARILGNILRERGILRNGCFFEHSGRDLCGRFVGETAPKTAAICRDAYGSVLFIDEAYSLYRDEGLSTADYGREAIDTLVAEMENHRNDLVVIMAGYPDEMDKLMNGNIGLKSRMPYTIEFPNYTREQLAEIFISMAKKGFKFDNEFEDAVKTYFGNLSDKIIDAKEFANARYVRNLFERTWGKAALRTQMDGSVCDTLTVGDFMLATSDKEFTNIMEQKKKPIGF